MADVAYLKEFIEVALTLNMSKAAKSLYVSQPSLSKHIAALEQECGAALFKRSGSRMQLTPAGQHFFEESFKLVQIYDEMIAKIRTLKDVVTLRVGGLYNSSTVIALVNAALARVNADAVTTTVAYQDYRHRSYAELLLEGRIDVAFTFLEGDSPPCGLEGAFLFCDPMICLVKGGHPLADRERIHVVDLAKQTILQPVGSYSTEHGRQIVHGIFARHGIDPREQPTFLHSISELSTIANDDCVLVMERSMLSSQPFTRDYRVLTLYEDDACFPFSAVYRIGDNGEELRRFVGALTEAAGEGVAL